MGRSVRDRRDLMALQTPSRVWSAAVSVAEAGPSVLLSGRISARSTGQRPVAAAQITQMEMYPPGGSGLGNDEHPEDEREHGSGQCAAECLHGVVHTGGDTCLVGGRGLGGRARSRAEAGSSPAGIHWRIRRRRESRRRRGFSCSIWWRVSDRGWSLRSFHGVSGQCGDDLVTTAPDLIGRSSTSGRRANTRDCGRCP